MRQRPAIVAMAGPGAVRPLIELMPLTYPDRETSMRGDLRQIARTLGYELSSVESGDTWFKACNIVRRHIRCVKAIADEAFEEAELSGERVRELLIEHGVYHARIRR